MKKAKKMMPKKMMTKKKMPTKDKEMMDAKDSKALKKGEKPKFIKNPTAF